MAILPSDSSSRLPLHRVLGCRGLTFMSCISQLLNHQFALTNRGSSRKLMSWRWRVRGRVGEREREKELEGSTRGREPEGGRRERGRGMGRGENWTLPLAARLVFPIKLPQVLLKPGTRFHSFLLCQAAPLGAQVRKASCICWCRDASPSLAGSFHPISVSVNRPYIKLSLYFLQLTFGVCPADRYSYCFRAFHNTV